MLFHNKRFNNVYILSPHLNCMCLPCVPARPPVTLSSEQLCTTFPYHLIFDRKLRLRQFGRTVARLSPVPLHTGLPVTSAFHVLYPRISFTVENILQFTNTIYILGVGPAPSGERNGGATEGGLSMKGRKGGRG